MPDIIFTGIEHKLQSLAIPISFFRNVQDNGRAGFYRDINTVWTWRQFVEEMAGFACEPYQSKESAPLFAPTCFNGPRCVSNASLSGLVVIDCDGGLLYDQTVEFLEQMPLEALVYTTATHKIIAKHNPQGEERFRIVIPLAEAVDIETQKRAVRAVCQLLEALLPGWKPDTSKCNSYSLFYTAGRYPGVENRFVHIAGVALSADEWLTVCPQPETEMAGPRQVVALDPNAHWDFEECDAVAIYRSLASDRHIGLAKLAVSLAMSAIHARYDLSADSLADILQIEHDANPPSRRYTPREIQHLATTAKDIAASRVTEPAFLRRAEWDKYQESEYQRYLDDVREIDEGHRRPCPEAWNDDQIEVKPSEFEPAKPNGHDNLAAPSNEPIDLFGSLSPDPVLTREMLPRAIADYAFDKAELMGVEPAGVAMAALVVCAGAIDDRFLIQPKEYNTEWLVPARLWLLINGVSGSGKTQSIEEPMQPLRKLQQIWREENLAALDQYQRDLQEYEAAEREYRARLKKGEDVLPPVEPEETAMRQLYTNGMTMEGLRDALEQNPRGILVYHNELTGLIGSLDAYTKSGVHKDRPLLLELFDGHPQIINRAKEVIHVKNWGASVVGGIQWSKLSPSLSEDGLLQRFLVITVESQGKGIDRAPDINATIHYDELVRNLALLKPDRALVTENGVVKPAIVLSPGAHEYRREVEDIAFALSKMPNLPEAFHSHADKLRGIFARLLLTLHMIEKVSNHNFFTNRTMAKRDLGVATTETAKQARDLMVKFLIPHALRLYTQLFGAANGAAHELASYILRKALKTLDKRDIDRNGPQQLRGKPGAFYKAVEHLETFGWLTPIAKKIGHNPTRWTVNPLVHSRFAERAEQERQRAEIVRTQIAAHDKTLRQVYASQEWPATSRDNSGKQSADVTVH